MTERNKITINHKMVTGSEVVFIAPYKCTILEFFAFGGGNIGVKHEKDIAGAPNVDLTVNFPLTSGRTTKVFIKPHTLKARDRLVVAASPSTHLTFIINSKQIQIYE